MTRHLNLLDKNLLLPPPGLPNRFILALLLALLMGMAAWGVWLGSQTQALQIEASSIEGRIKAVQGSQVGANRASREAALDALRQQVQAREAQLSTLQEAQAAGERAPASQWLVAMAAMAGDEVWLQHVTIQANGEFKLAGRAVSGNALNDYLQRWRRQAEFSKAALRVLNLQREDSSNSLAFVLGNRGDTEGASTNLPGNELGGRL